MVEVDKHSIESASTHQMSSLLVFSLFHFQFSCPISSLADNSFIIHLLGFCWWFQGSWNSPLWLHYLMLSTFFLDHASSAANNIFFHVSIFHVLFINRMKISLVREMILTISSLIFYDWFFFFLVLSYLSFFCTHACLHASSFQMLEWIWYGHVFYTKIKKNYWVQ